MSQLPKFDDPNILVGGDAMDDAGVYALSADQALVQTLDVLTPVADDPHVFGQIAAANALSDIYAMGARPLTVLCFVGYPVDDIPHETISIILKGVADAVRSAGAALIGGHTTKDRELKLGVSVTGVISPGAVLTKSQARPGDMIILTKPLGTGIITTALKADMAPEPVIVEANNNMLQLNDQACQAMIEAGALCATDITGFGLLGHVGEIAEQSDVSIMIFSREVPLMTGALELARMGLFPLSTHLNFKYALGYTVFSQNVDSDLQRLLCDAQTSGGLLIAIQRGRADALLTDLHRRGVAAAKIIGEVAAKKERRMYVE